MTRSRVMSSTLPQSVAVASLPANVGGSSGSSAAAASPATAVDSQAEVISVSPAVGDEDSEEQEEELTPAERFSKTAKRLILQNLHGSWGSKKRGGFQQQDGPTVDDDEDMDLLASSDDEDSDGLSVDLDGAQERTTNVSEAALLLNVKNEIKRFRDACKDLPTDPKQTNPFQWWSQHKHEYEHLPELARIVLSIPGSQIECERVFSVAGLITAGLRNRLGVENLDALVFIQKNADSKALIRDALVSCHGMHMAEQLIESEGLIPTCEEDLVEAELSCTLLDNDDAASPFAFAESFSLSDTSVDRLLEDMLSQNSAHDDF
eukprot:scaffold236191_cov31-Prasinocladus_malaysianus.AAC.1